MMRKLLLAGGILVVLTAVLIAVAYFAIRNPNPIAEFHVPPSTSVRLYFPEFWEVLVPVHCDFIENGKVSVDLTVDYVDPDEIFSWGSSGLYCYASPDGRLIGILRGDQDPTTCSFRDLGNAVVVVADLDQRIAIYGGSEKTTSERRIFERWQKSATR